MSILRAPSVPLYRNPLFRPALDALAGYLERRNYSQHARARIVAYAAVNGTPTGCESLDHRDDEAGATEAFVAALPPVALGSEAWDPAGVYIDAESILAAADRRRIPRDDVLVPPELEGDFDGEPRHDPVAMLAGVGLAPIAGGAPLPFEPSDEDWRDYSEWSRSLEARDDRPRPKDADDRGRDTADVAEFYRLKPGA